MKKLLILDANILIRAVLGVRVLTLIQTYHDDVAFVTAAYCYKEANRHLPTILKKRGLPIEPFLETIETLSGIVSPLDATVYNHYEMDAKQRIQERDVHDWPIVALALALGCPIWTEDKDFFGIGIPTWTSRNVEIYLASR